MHEKNAKPQQPKVGDDIIVRRTNERGTIESVIGNTKVLALLESGYRRVMEHREYHVVRLPKAVEEAKLRAVIDHALAIGDKEYFMELTGRLNALLDAPLDAQDITSQLLPSLPPDKRVTYSAIIDLGLDMKDYKLVEEYNKLLHEGDL